MASPATKTVPGIRSSNLAVASGSRRPQPSTSPAPTKTASAEGLGGTVSATWIGATVTARPSLSAAVTSSSHLAAGSAAAASNVVGSVYSVEPLAPTGIETSVRTVDVHAGIAAEETVTFRAVILAALPAVSWNERLAVTL